ncbi:RNA polymerase sigma-70 factor [Niabella aurantiaca]|uniref:RNA polymerase sigma-70 factor n=1 Tax=Niabella aurantiaca TaxID=379900 RepID=UPI000381E362|nr:RNA polymerase sigma-70 factor [Niabella aurantiaca]
MGLDSVQYKHVFDLHYEALYGYACSILRSEVYAEDLLQNIFIKLWETRGNVNPVSVKAYLYTAVRNECLNHLKHKGVQATYAHAVRVTGTDADNSNRAEQKELQEKIQGLLNRLPEKCATVFYMCRQLGLSYRQVAAELDLSVKTVENHMTKALKFLRGGLAAYLVSVLLLFIYQLFNV